MPPPARPQRVRGAPATFDPSAYDAARQHDAGPLRQQAPPEVNVVEIDDPTSVAAALRSPHADAWRAAIQEELDAHQANETYRIAPLPPGRKAISSRFVFKTKVDEHGTPVRYKARWVAKGFQQREGVDYFETFAPTLRWSTFRFLCAVSVQRDLELTALDVATAFLVPPIKEEVYMLPPPGDHGITVPPGHALLLQRCLYGLKQSGRAWHKNIDATLRRMGFAPSSADPCLYVQKDDQGVVSAAIAIYVDDCVIAAPASDQADIIAALKSHYKMTGGDPLHWFLGVRVKQDSAAHTVSLDQAAYAADILKRMNMSECKPVSTPAESRLPVISEEPDQEEQDRMLAFATPYRRVVGALLYLSGCTRPDITFVVNHLARFMAAPRLAHWQLLRRCCRYLQGTLNYGILYRREEENMHMPLAGFSDADWAGDVETRRSTSGMVFMMAGAAISWRSKSQKTVALSTCEAELMALAATLQEALWLRRLQDELQVSATQQPIQLWGDNQGANILARDHKFSNRTKHMALRYFFIREQLELGAVTLDYCCTEKMIADIFTKPLQRILFQRFRKMLGLVLLQH